MGASSKRQAVLHALADPTRDLIVRMLVDRERSVGEIAEQLPVSRPAHSPNNGSGRDQRDATWAGRAARGDAK